MVGVSSAPDSGLYETAVIRGFHPPGGVIAHCLLGTLLAALGVEVRQRQHATHTGAPIPRDFVPWRFSDADRRRSQLPASENLHRGQLAPTENKTGEGAILPMVLFSLRSV